MAGCSTHHHGQAGCSACQAEWRRYESQRRAQLRNGTWQPRVEPGPVLQHVAWLQSEGMSLNRIAEAAGASSRTLQRLGRGRWVTGALAAAILGVRPATHTRAGLVPTVNAARRVQSLFALGWSFTDQAHTMGVAASTVWEIAHEVNGCVSQAVFDRVTAMFEQLSGSPGPSGRAKSLARRRGWLPPLAWDDIDAGTVGDGDVDVSPVDEVAVERALAGERIDLSDAELLAAARIGAARGMTPWALSEVLRMNVFGARRLMAGELPPRRAKRAARAAGVAS